MALIVVALLLLILLAFVVLDSQVGRALARRLERTGLGGPTAPPTSVEARIALLEGEVERLGSEVGDLSDQNHFLTELLTKSNERTAELSGRRNR